MDRSITEASKKLVRRLLRLPNITIDKVLGRQFVHFLHVGKTGGTAVKDALKDNLRTERVRILLHSHQFTLRDVPKNEKTFFFVRDPVKRFVSGFNSRQRQGQPRYHRPWSEAEKTAFSTFTSANELAAALSSSNIPLRRQAMQAMNSIQHVRDSYWYWFEDETYLKSRLSDVLLVGRQETLASDFELLKRILGLPAGLTLPSDRHRAHRNAQRADKDLSEIATKNLKVWYRRDYEFIEFCAQHASALHYRYGEEGRASGS